MASKRGARATAAQASKAARAPAKSKKAAAALAGAPALDPEAQYTCYWHGVGRSQMTGAIITSGWHYYGPRVKRIADADGKDVFTAKG